MSPGPLVLMILAGSVNTCDVSECQDDSQGLLQLMKAKHRDPWCSASPGCSKLGLAGACCPTAGGLYLHCCRGGTSHNDTTMQSTTAVHSKPTTSFRTQTTHLTTTEPTTSYMTQATHTTTTIRNRPSAVQLSCSGEGFLDCWTFFTKADPTHGYIQYVSQREAMQLGLYSLRDGAVRLGSLVGQNRPVKAVRLQSKMRFYAGHLFVIDIKHMPTGGRVACSALQIVASSRRWGNLASLVGLWTRVAEQRGDRHHRDGKHRAGCTVDPAHQPRLQHAELFRAFQSQLQRRGCH